MNTQTLRVANSDITLSGSLEDPKCIIKEPTLSYISKAVDVLKNGDVVAFPTETVYGLGANALDPLAVRKIFNAKNRPSDNPLIVHISSLTMLRSILPSPIPAQYTALMDAFWPGPLTLLFPRHQTIIPDEVCHHHPTVAVRFPAHPLARALISQCGFPLAAPSANASGRPSPTLAMHVLQDLKGKIPLILDGGQVLDVGIESTVVDGYTNTDPPLVLRPGMITADHIHSVGGQFWARVQDYKAGSTDMERNPTTPGMKYRHYQPNAELVLFATSETSTQPAFEEKIKATLKDLPAEAKIGVMRSGGGLTWPRINAPTIDLVDENATSPSLCAEQVARNLFSGLRHLDDVEHATVILVQGVPDIDSGVGVMNRLRKAASTIVQV